MKARNGQVALYLVLVLVAVTVLMMMNVGSYLAVSARNRTMNAGDAAALAVARHQGELLNRIGEWNLEHLKAALENDAEKCETIAESQLRCCFLDPLEGIEIGNEAAKNNGVMQSDDMLAILRRHVADIRMLYESAPDLYPEPWKGAWEEYALKLEIAIGAGMWAGPDNINFIDAATGGWLMNRQFYHAIAALDWCWFHYNAESLLHSYSSFRDWELPIPPDEETRRRRAINSEVYSLHLDLKVGSAVDLLGTNLICRLTGATMDDLASSYLITNRTQKWFFYDTYEWRRWWEIDPDGEWQFPVVGRVREEYDVRGCAAMCRVRDEFVDLVNEDVDRVSIWAALARPFGTVENAEGEASVVTANRAFVTPAFRDVRLVPLGTMGDLNLATADGDWVTHVRDHLPDYFEHGPRSRNCYYCQQLVLWEREAFRSSGIRWIKYNASTCVRPSGPGPARGGAPYAH